MDRWDAMTLLGAGLAGAGVWGRFGWAWACILEGVLLLAIVAVHAHKGGR